MMKGNLFKKAYEFFLYALVFCLPFPMIMSAACVVGLALCWLPATKVKDIPAMLLRNKLYIFWIVYFVLHAISYTYSTDKGQSLFDLQRKLSFILLPLAIGTGPEITQTIIRRIFIAFAAGLTIIAVMCIGYAEILYLKTGNINQFFYHALVATPFASANAVYSAWYVFFSLCTLFFYPWQLTQPWQKGARLASIIILLVFFVLLSSRLLLVLLLIVVVIGAIRRFRRQFSSRKIILVTVAAATIITGSIALSRNPISQRFRDIIKPDQPAITYSADGKTKVFHFTNATVRLFIWHMAIDNIREYSLWWRGCGNGDVDIYQTQQVKKWERAGYDFTYNRDIGTFNLHNMYLQSLLMLGIPGLIVFCLIVFYPIFYIYKARDIMLLTSFNLCAVLFFMQEAAFQTQSGVIFYAFFSVVLWRLVKSQSITNAYTSSIT